MFFDKSLYYLYILLIFVNRDFIKKMNLEREIYKNLFNIDN